MREREDTPIKVSHLSVVPTATRDLAALRALAYAASLSVALLAFHVGPSEAETERFTAIGRRGGDHLPLEVVVSPYRARGISILVRDS